MRTTTLATLILLHHAGLGLAGCLVDDELDPSDALDADDQPAYRTSGIFVPTLSAEPYAGGDRLDQLYYVQPHNTYETGYQVRTWLEHGFRSVELDVLDRGDWDNEAQGPYVSHDAAPGHQDCSGSGDTRLGDCLDDIVGWIADEQAAGRSPAPVIVFIDMKASWDPLHAWEGHEVADLDHWIRDRLGPALYTFQSLYQDHLGSPTNPRDALASAGWPTVDSLRSRVIVALTGGKIGGVNQGMAGAMDELRSQGFPATMMCPDVESDPEELDTNGTIDGISASSSKWFVCSNLKSRDHYQVTANRAAHNKQLIHLWGSHVYDNTAYNYNYLAIAHGISAIGRDMSSPFVDNTFGGALPLVGRRRSLPGYFRLHPSSDPDRCMDVSGASYHNGARLHSWTCHGGDNQRFVYTAEGQLRPQGDNRYCVDIKGGDAGNDRDIHLWDCDGGQSEKWVLTPHGMFENVDDDRAYCLDADNGQGADWETYGCDSDHDQQIFHLEAVAAWTQTSF